MRAGLPGHQLEDSLRLAENYAFLGLHDEAFDTLTKNSVALAGYAGADLHLWRLRRELGVSPFLEVLHADPRWAVLLAETP